VQIIGRQVLQTPLGAFYREFAPTLSVSLVASEDRDPTPQTFDCTRVRRIIVEERLDAVKGQDDLRKVGPVLQMPGLQQQHIWFVL
jgi:hypothetical protein